MNCRDKGGNRALSLFTGSGGDRKLLLSAHATEPSYYAASCSAPASRDNFMASTVIGGILHARSPKTYETNHETYWPATRVPKAGFIAGLVPQAPGRFARRLLTV